MAMIPTISLPPHPQHPVSIKQLLEAYNVMNSTILPVAMRQSAWKVGDRIVVRNMSRFYYLHKHVLEDTRWYNIGYQKS